MGSKIPASQDESDRQLPALAPLEDHAFSIGQHAGRDSAHPAGWTIFKRIHPRVVQAKVKRKTLPIQLIQPSLDGAQIVRARLNKVEPDSIGAFIAIKIVDGDIDLP